MQTQSPHGYAEPGSTVLMSTGPEDDAKPGDDAGPESRRGSSQLRGTGLPWGPQALPRETVAEHQRERLFKAMVEAVNERGFVATTISDLVTRAGISRRSFDEHFQNKEECLLATYDTIVEHLEGRDRRGSPRPRAGPSSSRRFCASCSKPPATVPTARGWCAWRWALRARSAYSAGQRALRRRNASSSTASSGLPVTGRPRARSRARSWSRRRRTLGSRVRSEPLEQGTEGRTAGAAAGPAQLDRALLPIASSDPARPACAASASGSTVPADGSRTASRDRSGVARRHALRRGRSAAREAFRAASTTCRGRS